MTLVAECKLAPYAETTRDAIFNGRTGVEADRTWIESFGPDCWILKGRGATVMVDHDTPPVGKVTLLTHAGGWWWATLEVDDEHADKVRDLLKPGRPVSIGARRLRYDDDHVIGIRMHRQAELEHVALVPDGKHPGYEGAAVTKVWERKAKPQAAKARQATSRQATSSATSSGGIDWRDVLPSGYATFRGESIDLQPGDELLLGSARHGIVWDGRRFTQPHARAA